MKHRQNKLLAAVLLLSTFVAAPAFSQSEIEKKAQGLFDAKDYNGCVTLLEKELQKPDASVNLIRIGMNANLRAGNPMSAALLASNLLKKVGTKDPDALFEAAQVAELSGDSELAISRYLSYAKKVRSNKAVDARIFKAVSYVIQNGTHEEAIEILCEREGAAANWGTVDAYMDGFMSRNEQQAAISLFRFVFGADSPCKGNIVLMNNILQRIWNRCDNFRKSDAVQFSNIITSCVYPVNDNRFNYGLLYSILERVNNNAEMENQARFYAGRRFLETTGMAPTNNNLLINPAVQYLKSKNEPESRIRVAKEIAGLAPNFCKDTVQAEDPLYYYIQIITDNKDAFIDVIDPTVLAKLVARYNELRNSPYNDDGNWGVFNNVVSGLYKEKQDKALAFAKALLPSATPQQAAWLFTQEKDAAAKKGGSIETYLSSAKGDFKKTARQMGSIAGIAAANDSANFNAGVKSIMLTGVYNENDVADWFRAARIPAADAVATISSVIGTQGSTARSGRLIDNLLSKGYPKNAKLEALKGNKNGSDAFYASAAKVFNLTGDQAAELDAAVDAFLKNYKGTVPPVANLAASDKELTAYNVMQWNKQQLWGKEEFAKKLINRWIPLMKCPGKTLDEFLQRAWNLDGGKRQGGLFYNNVKYAAKLVSQKPGSAFWNMNDFGDTLIQPAGQDTNVFPSYAGMETAAARYIIKSHEAWSKDYFFKQVESYFSDPKATPDRNATWYFISLLGGNNFKYKGQIPVSTVKAIVNGLVAQSARSQTIDFEREVQALNLAAEDQKVEVAKAYADAIKKRTPRERMASINNYYGSSTTYAAGAAFADAALKPLLSEWSEKEWKQVPISAGMLRFFWNLQKDEKATADLKSTVAPLAKTLRSAVLRGSAVLQPYNISDAAEVLVPGVKEVVKSGNVPAINRAAVVVGSSLNRSNSGWYGKNVANAMLESLEKTTPQIQYVFLNSFTNGTSSFNAEMKNEFNLKMSALAKSIPGLVPVDKNDAAYNMFLAQQMKREGNALQAWSLIREKMPLFTQRWKEFDFDFALWVVEQARKSSMFKEAMELGQTMWMDEGKLTPGDAAKLGLSKGDVYRDWKSYPAAKIEYESLTNNSKYNKTPAGRLAKFRLIELLILTQDYTTARTMLERLQTSKTQDDQAEAYYLQARIDYEMQDDEAAMQNLAEVFQRNSSHPEARLLQGQIMLRTNKLTFLELEIGQKKLATVAIPGKPIKLLIQDNNLSVIRGGKSLPVLVTTSKGKDSEIVELMPSQQDPNKFSIELPTCLGKAVPNNMILELCGEDEIVYQIEPKFQAENGKTNLPPNRLSVRFPAKLYASSQTILSDEEQEEMKMLESLELTSGMQNTRSQSTVVRPGSPIYLRVVDSDMSLNPNKPNSVFVDVSCSSGDMLNQFELKETGDCTGVFEGKIETGIPFPNTIVSDVVEGLDVNAVINSKKTGSWKSQPDGKRPKWLEIDTMTSCSFKEASIKMPNPTAIKNLSVTASIDKNSDLLASYPSSASTKEKGGFRTRILQRNESDLRRLQKLFLNSSDEGIYSTKPVYSRDFDAKLRNSDRWICGELSGAFYLPESTEMELKFMQKPDDRQTAHLLIDDRLLISARMNATGIATKRSLTLTKGIHTLKVYFNEYSKNSGIQVGMLQPDGSYKALPSEWFNAEKNPLLAEYLKPKGRITRTEDGFRLTLDKPLRYRRIRWVFEDFNGNSVEVTKASAVDDKGKVIVPVEQDLSSGKDNKILEVAAADTITVKYEDKKRIDDNKAVITETLSSSFYDATAGFYYEEVKVNDEGKTLITLSPAARATKGDDVIVTVCDPDEDRSDEREVVPAELITSSGEKIKIELLGGEFAKGHRGMFRETFRLGDKTDAAKRTLKVVPGDKVTLRYLDKENNHPGIPFYRTAVLDNNEGSRPDLTIFDTTVEMIEDRSPAALAKIQMIKNKQGNRAGDVKLYKEQIVAKPIITEGKKDAEEVLIVNSKAPLLMELTAPDLAKHAGSTAVVEVLTTTEMNAADEERRERTPLRVEMPLKSLTAQASAKGYPVKMDASVPRGTRGDSLLMGVFSGVVRLQLGSANDEINDMVSSNEAFNLLDDNKSLDSDAFKVPTVIVSGSDKLYISFKDAAGKELSKRTVQLRSDGELELFDKAYLTPQKSVHLGQHFYVRVHDPDRDITADRDVVEVEVKSDLTKDAVTLKLTETLVHSGIFTGSLKVDLKRKPLAGEAETQKLDANTLWSNFGDKISFAYTDLVPLHSDKPQKITKTGEVVIGSDGEMAAFTKRFKDPDMAVKTNFLMAEALFEMAKSHKAIKGADGKPDPAKVEQAKHEIAKGKRVLEEALRDYPNTSLKAQGEFLLANLSQQLEDYKNAIIQFTTVISKYPESEYAPKSYYQKAVCYEKLAEMEKEAMRKQQIGDLACEEYVRLTYLYPNSSLSTDAKLRLGRYYHMTKRYRLAASVLEKFGMSHPEHPMAPQALLAAGYASVRNEKTKEEQAAQIKRQYTPDYTQAIRIFTTLEEKYKDAKKERAQALYYAGDCLYQLKAQENKVKAYQYFQRLIWDYPESKWAKYARGRMAANPIKNTR